MVWLATHREDEEEAAKMRKAMEVSLEQAEQERAKQPPLCNLSEPKLRAKFETSVLLPKVV